MKRLLSFVIVTSVLISASLHAEPVSSKRTADNAPRLLSLDGNAWQVAVDPQNVGKAERWDASPRPEAKKTRVPWILQDAFPGYHGVAWYWRDFVAPANAFSGGRYLLRFGAVDYLAEVWLNGVYVGGHEGGETPFALDVTGSIKPGASNRLAVRILNPTNEPIDGIVLAQTARRCKVIPYSAGAAFNHGGITGSVELAAVREVRVEDLFVTTEIRPDSSGGIVRAEVQVRNAGRESRKAMLEVALAPAAGGETLAITTTERDFPPGDAKVEVELPVAQPHRWELNDPYLYRATASLRTEANSLPTECSTRFGFRDFRFTDGYFRLNGRRIYLRWTHTCNHFPIGLQLPHDPDLLRRDLLNLKAMGFNGVRFIWGAATPTQLDYCDEIGLLVYEESYASMPIADSPKMVERFDANVAELLRRDRNHPSVVMWGLLNEAPDGPAFRHAVKMLPLVRGLDKTRMVMLNSGRYDGVNTSAIAQVSGLRIWPKDSPTEPWVAVNATQKTIQPLGITWAPGQLALHPGPNGEFSVIRWTAPAAGKIEMEAVFTGIAEKATTDVHVLQNGRPLFDAALNLNGRGNEAKLGRTLAVAAGDTLDFVVGYGNGHYGADSTALALKIRSENGKVYDGAADFSTDANPNGVWTYGRMLPGASPATATFARHPVDEPGLRIGSLSNPGSTVWEDVIEDRHLYPRVPHTGEIADSIRRMSAGRNPVFLSEYGIGSAVDLWRAVRHFEQEGAERLEDAQFFSDKLNRFLADYQRWKLDEAFPRPEDFFAASLSKMAGQRLLGLNAIRSNPNIVGHSLTGAIDHVMCGEGLTTLFRELKPGTIDALFDGWAPLRWCLFAEPVHLRRGSRVRLDAVLANEDALSPGEYPVRIQVIGPDSRVVFDRTITVSIPNRNGKAEVPFAMNCFSQEAPIDGPEGKYRFTATFVRGAAAAGGQAEFYVTDSARMPPVASEIVLWGDDPELVRWLAEKEIRTKPFSAASATNREVILATAKPSAPGGAQAFRELSRRMARGDCVVFLSPEVFAQGNESTRWLPLARKGSLTPIQGWLYLKDEWAKAHPIFDGLPAGGLMDYTYYREIIPDLLWMGQDPPAEAVAGAIKASQDYGSGLMVAVYPSGAGRFVLNTLKIRENLDHPAAERLLRNLLRYAARDATTARADLPADFETQLKAIGY